MTTRTVTSPYARCTCGHAGYSHAPGPDARWCQMPGCACRNLVRPVTTPAVDVEPDDTSTTPTLDRFGAEPTADTARRFTEHMLERADGVRHGIANALADWDDHGPWTLAAAAANLRDLAGILDEVAAVRIEQLNGATS